MGGLAGLHGLRDALRHRRPRFRLAYFGAMLAIAAMAVLVADVAHGVHSGAFAVAYVVLRSIMLVLYWRA